MTQEEKTAILKALPKNSRVIYTGPALYGYTTYGRTATTTFTRTKLTQNAVPIITTETAGFKLRNGRNETGSGWKKKSARADQMLVSIAGGRWFLPYEDLTCNTIKAIERITS